MISAPEGAPCQSSNSVDTVRHHHRSFDSSFGTLRHAVLELNDSISTLRHAMSEHDIDTLQYRLKPTSF
ncbi:hypothetical protein RchiOBHm_Chr4g0427631 [Rosa chinensis]|uniref:Uncharacterized protein n=1 Tax=Rosa chinensis TaxID=74649 RepID=A0A2P6QZN9_ROSCH|nr:hypothetical protein RchiOBHm_Chr4g0427631 [Rosa chinensis]